MSMSKVDAMVALANGEILTHVCFTDKEWVRGYGNNMYIFEDGSVSPMEHFWVVRKEDYFDSGWSIKNV